MRIVFSKDRAAQLDLLLCSLERHAEPEPAVIIVRASAPDYAKAYNQVWREHESAGYVVEWESGPSFETQVRYWLATARTALTFLCDDDILYRRCEQPVWADDPELLCFSLRYGQNTTVCYPTGRAQPLPAQDGEGGRMRWDWRAQPAGSDFGYPGSIDGHVFRAADVRRMLAGRSFANPTGLEDALMGGCRALAEERPLMACYQRSVLVGVPVNRVSGESSVRHGATFPVSAEECNRRFLAGERFDLDAIDFAGVNSAHCELELRGRETAA